MSQFDNVRQNHRAGALTAALAALVMFLGLPAFAAIEYTVVDIGFLSGDAAASGSGLNEKGEVVGYSQDAASNTRAFIWTAAEGIKDLGRLGSDNEDYWANRINNAGVIVGYSDTTNPSVRRGTVWSGSAITEVPPLPYATPTIILNDINQNSTMCGLSKDGGFERAVRYRDGQLQDLGVFSGYTRSVGYGLNDLDQCVGDVFTSNVSETRAFVFKLSMQLVPTTGGTYNTALDINNNGFVVGYSLLDGDTDKHGFVWDGVNPPVEVGSFLGGTQSVATSINNNNVAVGVGYLSGNTDVAGFIYKNDTETKLNELIDPASGWDIKRAEAINDKGQITGVGIKGGQTRAILLNPIPAPGVAAEFTFDAGAESWTAATSIPPFEDGVASTPAGSLAISADGNFPVFAFWLSPEIGVETGKTYEATFTVTSTVLLAADVPQFRLRVNQNGTNLAVIVAVDSEGGAAPTTGIDRVYKARFTPFNSGGALAVRLALDLTHFNPVDNANGAILLKDAKVVEVEE